MGQFRNGLPGGCNPRRDRLAVDGECQRRIDSWRWSRQDLRLIQRKHAAEPAHPSNAVPAWLKDAVRQ